MSFFFIFFSILPFPIATYLSTQPHHDKDWTPGVGEIGHLRSDLNQETFQPCSINEIIDTDEKYVL